LSVSSTSRTVGSDRGEQRAGEQELLGEHVVAGRVPGLALRRRDAQQLLGVVPLVERAGLVDALVALQAHQARPGGLGDRPRELGLADPGRALHQQGLAEAVGQEHGRRHGGRGEVTDTGEPCRDVVDRVEEPLGRLSVHVR